jgi:LysR family hydrogen peroxide-inducible transcriptional activator
MKNYPRLRLKLVEEKTEILIEQLKIGKIDAAFLALPIKEDGLESHYLFEEEFLLAVAKTNSWAAKKRITRAQLKNHDLLLLEEGHCLRDQALEFCTRTGAGEFPDFRASSMETLQQMVAADIGMTLIPKMASRKEGAVAYIPFEKPKPSRTIGLIWRRSSVRKELLRDLHQRLAKSLPKLL